ncbi:MAG TPA: hypothetical protein VM753_01175 [Anaeromyxobacter sp.]|jgi:hypothetical protein|nr:hypothetical protein [Anaeromyxobacter sp.]
MARSLPSLLLLLFPLLLLGFAAGVLRALAARDGLSPRRRRALQAAWVLTLLVGTPLWLILAAALRLW